MTTRIQKLSFALEYVSPTEPTQARILRNVYVKFFICRPCCSWMNLFIHLHISSITLIWYVNHEMSIKFNTLWRSCEYSVNMGYSTIMNNLYLFYQRRI